MHLDNIHSEYVDPIWGIFDKTPKVVFAAIAVSLATMGGEHLDEAQKLIIKEWQVLFDNGIIKQDPHKYLGKETADGIGK